MGKAKNKPSKKKSAKKKTKEGISFSKLKSTLLTRDALIYFSVFVFGIFLFSILFQVEYERTERKDIYYLQDETFDDTLELGEEIVQEEGEIGYSEDTYRYKRSLFAYIFNWDTGTRTLVQSEVIEMPKREKVTKGTKKWQYMICSDGTYRWYTDEQFEDFFTGFTSKSPDSCAENGNGKMVRLADSPDGSQQNRAAPKNVADNCIERKLPYKTDYEDASWLQVGETSEMYDGFDGYEIVCNGVVTDKLEPLNKLVYVGTAQPYEFEYTEIGGSSGGSDTSESGPDYAAKSYCDSEYSSGRSQIVAAGAANSSAMDQLNAWYAGCLSDAGF